MRNGASLRRQYPRSCSTLQPSEPMVACSLPDILRSEANTFQHFSSTAGHSLILCHQRFALCTRLARVLLLEGPM
jgi:hypothetical protein